MSISDKVGSVVLVDGHHGRYVPMFFIDTYEKNIIAMDGLSEEISLIKQMRDEDGTQNDNNILDAWVYIIDTALVLLDDGNEYALYTNENGDLIGYSTADYDALTELEQYELWEEMI